MNTLAGLQFQARKPSRAPATGQSPTEAISTTPHRATRPSSPSMKLVKLITAVIATSTNGRAQIGSGTAAIATSTPAVATWAA